MIIFLTVIAMFPYLKKQPKEILSEMEGLKMVLYLVDM